MHNTLTMKRLTNTMMALLASASLMAQQLPMSELVEGLMSKMTLKEKIGQLNLLDRKSVV